jgi:hypothetical protein
MTRTSRTVARLSAALALAGLAGAGPSVDTSAQKGAAGVSTFSLADVRLGGGPFERSQALNLKYLEALDVDRLLAPYRADAGLQPRGETYPNWESAGLQGHTAGHYLTAVAQAWAAAGDVEMKRRLDYMVRELAECQRANGNGYVGAIPGGRQLWADVAAGSLRVERFGLNGKWVPWYNLHKLFAGLRDAHLVGGNAEARDVLVGLAGWSGTLVANLSDTQVQQMLVAEHGGMNEVLADVFALTGDRRFLALAQRFSDRALLEPLLRREDPLTGLHANTQIPKVVGYARIAELGGDATGEQAARFFWETVVRRRTVAFGGNSVREHFNPSGDFSSMIESREGPETCNTYNMLRLTEQLYRRSGEAAYVDFYERALFNHILSTQHPGHGGFVYFTPIRPRHYRVYSQPSQCFWCCVGTGLENHSKHGRFIYARAGDDRLFVNLFIASTVHWRERGISLRQDTAFPDEGCTRLVLALDRPQRFTLNVRRPAWAGGDAFRIRINGTAWAGASRPSSYAAIAREWRDGDRIDVDLPMRTTAEPLPDGSDYVALLHGPILLAAKTGTERLDGLIAGDGRMAHVSPGPYLPLDGAPMLVGDPDTLADHVTPVPGRPLTFTAPGIIRPATARRLELTPFFRVHDSRYVIYWRAVPPEAYGRVVAALGAEETSRLDLERRTLDRVSPGEQQPEIEHDVRAEGSSTGATHGRRWRDATGWFSYDLTTGGARGPLALRVTYSAGDRNRQFDIVVEGRRIATVALDGRRPDRFDDVTYPIPGEIVEAATDGVLTVRFMARPGSRAGAVYDVRLVRVTRRRP